MCGKKCRKVLACVSAAALLAASGLQGCGGSSDNQKAQGQEAQSQESKKQEEALAEMKEFSTGDGSVTISLDKDWDTEDLGVDFWLGAGSTDGAKAVLVMQFPKEGTILPSDSMDSVKSLVNESYGVTDETDTETPTIPGITGLSGSIFKIDADEESAEAYLVFGETDYAYYSLMYVADTIGDKEITSMKASCASFSEKPLEIEDNTTVELTDTVRWFNASYAVLTELNGQDYNRFAGLPANETTKALEQQSLDEWWGVTDRASADETLTWILNEGHRFGFVDNCKYLEESGLGGVEADKRQEFILDNFEVSEEEAQAYISSYALYEEFGEHAIDGWDYCRAMNLVSFYYLAGYYTEQEALDKSLEIAQTIQPLFESWDDLIGSYMRGYEYWAEESSAERQAVYEDLKTRADNPFAVDFKMALEKTW